MKAVIQKQGGKSTPSLEILEVENNKKVNQYLNKMKQTMKNLMNTQVIHLTLPQSSIYEKALQMNFLFTTTIFIIKN